MHRAAARADERVETSVPAATYIERPPAPGLAGVVRTLWVQRTAADPYVQRHLPTGGVELHVPVGSDPRLLGPLTGSLVEVIPPNTTLLGARFRPGTAPLPAGELGSLVDRRANLRDLWGSFADRLRDDIATAPSPQAGLDVLQAHLTGLYRRADRPDALVLEAAGRLMPWRPTPIAALAYDLSISTAQLRRRCLHTAGLTPKALQRILRFQGFLALAQAGAPPTGRRDSDGLAGMAVDVGYADQAHLSRECLRLTGLTPRELLGGGTDRCLCGHDHAASFRPFLATRRTTTRHR